MSNKSSVPGVIWDGSRNRWRAYSAGEKHTRVYLGSSPTREGAESLRLQADQGLSPTGEKSASLDKSARLRMRAVWREMLKENPDQVWTSFDQFVSTVGDRPEVEKKLIAKDETTPIGPNNFRWVAPEYDFLTVSGRNSYLKMQYAKDPLYYRKSELRRKFGLTLEDYQGMVEAQNGLCAICGRPETALRLGKVLPLAVDHCHSTGETRGLLCTACNIGIGSLQDNPATIRAAANYVEKWDRKLSPETTKEVGLVDNLIIFKSFEFEAGITLAH